ncbi:putative membrane protein [Devosia enhydra]|uniref:Putative membrane protein n=1 Tax=Devosia enhydra TaxID=665118 RepID=A0A1K2I3G0_9HYPH|nr:cytochrome c oxidase assembly protein [Devosia enhydra]SFZ86292.1 putative membrane protein [Devosia enhydra]
MNQIDALMGGASYCGPPPTLADLWSRWNFDPLLLAALALGLGLYLGLARTSARAQMQFAAGWAVLAVAFVSPLCALTVALFSARVAHHLLLVAVAAPLLALGLPEALRRWASPHGAVLLLAHTGLFWLWHVPDAYAVALGNDAVYWLMQTSLLTSAMLFWAGMLDRTARPAAAIGGLVAASMQMGLLGALLTFAPEPLYAPHLDTTAAYALSAVADQQLAGLMMWVPGALPYLAGALVVLMRVLGTAPLRGEGR